MKIFICMALFWCSFLVFAQDERFYREIFTKKLFEQQSSEQNFKIVASTSDYHWDFNHDGTQEMLSFKNKDGVDYICLKDQLGKILFEQKLETKGRNSKVLKITGKTLTPTTDIYIIHFYEGVTQDAFKKASGALYFLTIDDRDFKSISLFKGPSFWIEHRELESMYRNRFYNLKIEDLNQDGRKEVGIYYKNISRVYFYLNQGRWKVL